MSRVADALRRAVQPGEPEELLRDDSHPWGEDLPETEEQAAEEFASVGVFRSSDSLGDLSVGPLVAAPVAAVAAVAPLVAHEPAAAAGKVRGAGPAGDAVHGQLAALVERVFLPVTTDPIRSVAFAGIGLDGESGSVAAGVAELLFKQTTATICVVDANFASPSIHQRFGLPNTRGLMEAFASGGPLVDAARQVQRNLWAVPAGSVGGRPSFSTTEAQVRMAQFLARFDHVLIHMEPLTTNGDATGVSRLADGVILVLSAGKTRKEAARRAAQRLRDTGVSVVGAVLTDRRFPIPDVIYRRL
jgi:Mrp family chromosome partitioning ATPase